MDKYEEDAPVGLSEDDARAGVTGHHVRYVLAFGLASVIIAFAIIGIYFGYDQLADNISQTLSRDPVTVMRDLAPYAIIIVVGAGAGLLLLAFWSMLAGRAENASQLGMRLRVVTQLIVICVIMAIVYLAVK